MREARTPSINAEATAEIETLRARHFDESQKLVYFALGIAASAIAFVFHETADRSVSASLYVIAASVLAWTSSFASGVWHCELRAKLRALDYTIARGTHSGEDVSQPLATYTRRGIWAGRTLYAQLWLLPVGAIAYGVGHWMQLK